VGGAAALAGAEKDAVYRRFLVWRALADYGAGQFDAAVEAIHKAVAISPDGRRGPFGGNRDT